jgi:hypothetical protein
MNLSIEGVRKILARVEERESMRLSKNVHRVKARQNGQLEHIIEEGFTAWHASKEPKRRAVRKSSGEGDDQAIVEHTEAVDQCGDPRHLHTVLAAHAAQRDLLGMNVDAAENPRWTLVDVLEDMERLGKEYEEHQKAIAEGIGVEGFDYPWGQKPGLPAPEADPNPIIVRER